MDTIYIQQTLQEQRSICIYREMDFQKLEKADTLQDQNINNNNKFNYIITNPPYGKKEHIL